MHKSKIDIDILMIDWSRVLIVRFRTGKVEIIDTLETRTKTRILQTNLIHYYLQ